MSDRKHAFLVVGIIFPIIAAVSVLLRFKARRLARQKLQTDDWLALSALVLSCGFTVTVLIDSRMGNLGGHLTFDEDGYPIIGDDDTWYTIFSLTNYAMQVIWNPTVGVTKLSIAFLYKRIFATYAFRMLTWGTIVMLAAWTIAFTLVNIFPCYPISNAWTTESTDGCVNFPAMYTAAVASNVATDIIVMLIPIYNVWNLHMPMRRKLGVVSIFCLGSFVIVTGIIRLVLLVRAYAALEDPVFMDITYDFSPPILWTVVEINLGVTCACLPLMRPVWRAARDSPVMTKLLKSFTGSYASMDKSDEAELGIISGDSGKSKDGIPTSSTPSSAPDPVRAFAFKPNGGFGGGFR
ncbi:hypothetical protein K505DRAFT_372933 [Melanomma pulvis-pyrius CBS 109.77]|uniref:Rhodopsin domain-containing protein n=1 Tax=Melanomma pulvis-pyrius CBS 109.77 TaxID=1314802 RepID=A0A6A6XJS0_9PLEO|nr:hypothetical protein K505DRAFT_372933 [Melanomma pulvis-pyrius CBS 109.77]